MTTASEPVSVGHLDRATPRERILAAAVALLAEEGREAVTTRAIMTAADVQAPTIYRQFGDLHGLLVEAASAGFAAYLADKATNRPSGDPVEDLRDGWDVHVAFGLAEPAVYALLYGDPHQGKRPAAVQQARAMLRANIQRIAEAGRLQVGVDLALEMVDAAGAGVVLHLLASEPARREHALSAAVREAVLSAVTIAAEGVPPPLSPRNRARTGTRAVALKAVLPDADGLLSAGELLLMSELLDRLTRAGATSV